VENQVIILPIPRCQLARQSGDCLDPRNSG
jgi:hypothetical protein